MRAAPPVSVRCTGGRGWQLVQAGIPALATAAITAWAMGHAGAGDAGAGAGAAAAAAAAGVLGWQQARGAVAVVSWNGQRWSVDGQTGRLGVMIDLGPWLLLRWVPDAAAATGRPRWVAVSAAEAGVARHGLRAALFARMAAVGASQPPTGVPAGEGSPVARAAAD